MIEVHAAERVGHAVTYGSGAAAIFFGLTTSDIAGIVAVLTCVASYFTTQGLSAYFRQKELMILERADEIMLSEGARERTIAYQQLMAEIGDERANHVGSTNL